LGNSGIVDDLAHLHATLSSLGGEGRGEEEIDIDGTTSSSALSGTFSSRGGEGIPSHRPEMIALKDLHSVCQDLDLCKNTTINSRDTWKIK